MYHLIKRFPNRKHLSDTNLTPHPLKNLPVVTLSLLFVVSLLLASCDEMVTGSDNSGANQVGLTDPPEEGAPASIESIAIEDLGVIEGRTFHEARAINQFGEITGISKTMEPPALSSFFLWKEAGGLSDAGRYNGSTSGTVAPHAINSSGVIVGENYPYAVIWSPGGGFQMLGEDAAAFGLNDEGVAVGTRSWPIEGPELPRLGTQAVQWTEDGEMVILETFSERMDHPVERNWNQAHDINSAGDVVGYSIYPENNVSGPRRAVIWSDGEIAVDLGTLGGHSEALAINDLRQVVGQSVSDEVSSTGKDIYFVIDEAKGEILKKDGYDRLEAEFSPIRSAGKTSAEGSGQNFQMSFKQMGSSGEPAYQVVANSERAFIWDEQNGMVSLGTHEGGPSIATDINNKGQVVGYILLPATDTETNRARGFYWDEHNGMILLEPLDESYTFSFAYSINDDGVIVGRSSTGQPGEMRAVKWNLSFEGDEPGLIASE